MAAAIVPPRRSGDRSPGRRHTADRTDRAMSCSTRRMPSRSRHQTGSGSRRTAGSRSVQSPGARRAAGAGTASPMARASSTEPAELPGRQIPHRPVEPVRKIFRRVRRRACFRSGSRSLPASPSTWPQGRAGRSVALGPSVTLSQTVCCFQAPCAERAGRDPSWRAPRALGAFEAVRPSFTDPSSPSRAGAGVEVVVLPAPLGPDQTGDHPGRA